MSSLTEVKVVNNQNQLIHQKNEMDKYKIKIHNCLRNNEIFLILNDKNKYYEQY